MRPDLDKRNGFSAYVSGMDTVSDLWNDPQAYKRSTFRQLSGKAVCRFDSGRVTAFAARSRTTQTNDFYLSINELPRGLGWDWGDYAPTGTRP